MRKAGRRPPASGPGDRDVLERNRSVPEITPFRALRYNTATFGSDLSSLIAPPYDVLDQADKDALLARSRHNIVAVDLPHVPPKSAGPDAVYARAAETLQQWLAEAALIEERQPALYTYHQVYTHAGRQFTRKMFFARMRLEAFGTGTVFPHEQTFGGPKEDRFQLMKATRCQLSAVFGLYSDPGNTISSLLTVSDREPDVVAEMEGVRNRLWLVQDTATIEQVQSLMQTRAVYIADGHHRYGTALNYRDALTAQTGPLRLDHPAQFVLVGFCAMEDEGAVILPTHRVLSGFGSVPPARVLRALEKGLTLSPTTSADPQAPLATGAADVVLYVADGAKTYAARFTQRRVLNALAPERTDPWRELDLAYLHRYLIDELVTGEALGGAAPTIHYIKAAPDAIADAKATGGIAVLCKPCTMDELRAVSEAGDLMPQKSTYFYPKLATGLVINRLE